MAHRPRWTLSQVTELFEKPLLDLLFEAQQVHRQHFDPRQVQVSTLLSIKTGACPEDCKYCPQSSRYKTGLEAERLMEVEQVLESARKAKAAGSTRFCMGAAWKNPHERDMPYLEQMVQGVKAMGLEACMTLGTLSESQAQRLANAGLDYYNHNLDTSPEFYGNIITTHLSGTPRYAGKSARCRDQSLLRWHCGFRRNGKRSRRIITATGKPADAAGKRANQHAREGERYSTGR